MHQNVISLPYGVTGAFNIFFPFLFALLYCSHFFIEVIINGIFLEKHFVLKQFKSSYITNMLCDLEQVT